MKQYRKKPVVVEVVQFTGDNHKEIESFTNGNILYNMMGQEIIKTLKGDMILSENDFVIKGVNGEFYHCKPDIFAATYDEI